MRFEIATEIPVDQQSLYDWHARQGAFERLMPPWADLRLLKPHAGIDDGKRVYLRMRVMGLPIDWEIEHREHIPGRQFEDHQVSGPFRTFFHRHEFEAVSEKVSRLRDALTYHLHGGVVADRLLGPVVRSMIHQGFHRRHRLTLEDLAEHQHGPEEPMTVAVSGVSGLVGRNFVPFLTTGGHQVRRIIRHSTQRTEDDILYSWPHGQIEAQGLLGCDAVVHLAGEPILGSWLPSHLEEMRRSRVESTRLLAKTLARLPRKPRVLVVASAIGYYGDRGEQIVHEGSSSGDGFFAELARDWEAAADPAREAGIRVVNVRFGLVLSPQGGALRKMLTPVRMGVAGRLGSGRQWWSWIGMDDAISILHRVMVDQSFEGPVNAVAPYPVTNHQFMRFLCRTEGPLPAWLHVPSPLVRLAFGKKMANESLLSSHRVEPRKLLDAGYKFRDPRLDTCLQALLGRVPLSV